MTMKEGAGAIGKLITLAKPFVAVVGGGLSIAAGGSWWLASLQADVRTVMAHSEKTATAVEKLTDAVGKV